MNEFYIMNINVFPHICLFCKICVVRIKVSQSMGDAIDCGGVVIGGGTVNIG